MKKIVVLTGAGISAESGLGTFRDSGGLWDNYEVEDVATPQGWKKDRELVTDFYNQRRRNCLDASPNEGHKALVELAKNHDVTIVTQNIDDLHERAGSDNVYHIHGEILKSRSTLDPDLIYDCTEDIKIGDKCEKGSQLRPHVVWFGEYPFHLIEMTKKIGEADVLVIVGTSLNVYPAANALEYVSNEAQVILVDPGEPNQIAIDACPVNIIHIKEPASTGVMKAVKIIDNE